MNTETLTHYKNADHPVPARMLRWHLYGAGLENFGRENLPDEVDVPAYGPDELLVRQDACGLCFSDTKVIALGENHPRMTGRDLARDPVTLGHEVSCTVVGVGERLQDRYHVGDRFVIQADVFYRGKSLAYGYALRGGLAEYSLISREILEGDEGCYLLPVRSETGYVESALTEPWACVVSAYTQAHRATVRPGGRLLVVGGPDAANREYDAHAWLSEDRLPAELILRTVEGRLRTELLHVAGQFKIAYNETVSSAWPDVKAQFAGGFDDILVLGNASPEEIEGAASCLADHGVLNLVRDRPLPRKLSLDIGRIHYNWHHYVGTRTGSPAEAYHDTRTADLLPGGIAWFLGAGGPMGQMHVQRAIQKQEPPRRIVATDVDTVRLQSVLERFGATAAERGIELLALNPSELGEDRFHEALTRAGDGAGFDDIVSMVPVARVIEHAADYLADGGWFNIFAGVARGTMAQLDVNKIVQARVRFLGSSGSSLADMRETLARVEQGDLSTNASLAAIGGMRAAAEGLRAVKEGRFPGKTLIFPLIHDLPLMTLGELQNRLPTVYAKLERGQFWTREAEEELLRLTVARA